jgi:hypothetical protein
MARPENAMEIFRLLDQSNCRECGEKTCLAFAGAVFQGRKNLGACPRLDPETVRRYDGPPEAANRAEQEWEAHLKRLQQSISELDLAEAAERTGGRFEKERLTLPVLGKHFSVDRNGRLSAEIHVNPWVAIPYLNYVLYADGQAPGGQWLPFRELKGGKERYPLFEKRCEEAMKQVADTHTDFFDDIVHMFSGKKVPEHYESDISVVLQPFPKVPVMICYWKPEDGLESSLHLFFDACTNGNLDIGSTFSLGAGLAQMFAKLALRHGFSSDGVPLA